MKDPNDGSDPNSNSASSQPAGRTGMSILMELRDYEEKLGPVGDLVSALASSTSADSLDRLCQVVRAFASKGNAVPKPVVKVVWLRYLDSKFQQQAFSSWASLCKLDMAGLPAEFRVFQESEVLALIEGHVAACLLSLLSADKLPTVDILRSPFHL